MAKNNDAEPTSVNMINTGTEIKGDILSGGDIRFDGILNGNLITEGKVVIGDTGHVKGEIRCKNSDIAGEIEGKIFVSELLSLKSTAKVLGDIQAGKLSIEPGCIFTGTCTMSSNHDTGERKRETQA